MFLASHHRENAQHLTVVGPGADSLTSKAGFETVIMGFFEALQSHGYVLRTTGHTCVHRDTVLDITGHATAGFCHFIGDFVVGLEAEAVTGENPFSVSAAVLRATTVLLDGAAGTLAPACPVENVPKKFVKPDSWFSGLGDARATGGVLIVPQLFVTGWHFYELSQTAGGRRGDPAHTAAVLGEVARLTGYASAICSAAALLMTLILSGMVDSRGPASTLQTSSRSSMATLLI
ncbi:hypothetical protein PG989_004193 [Apiospora arundinis]